MQKRLFAFLLILVIFPQFACDDEDLEAPVPAYFKIDDIQVNPTDPVQGSASDNIKDAWVYIGDQLLGVFELPAVVPIQKTGQVRLQVAGGILNNGLSNDRAQYAFYQFFQIDTFLLPEQELDIIPVVEYQPNANYDSPWSGEDFESGINFNYNANSDTVFFRETIENKFEGTASGRAILTESMDFFEAYTPTFSDIPRDGRAVYLEMDYFCTHDIAVSVYTNDRQSQFSVVNFRPTGGWNKAYVELSPVFSSLFAAFNYNIAIGFVKPIGERGELYLDNVKLISF